MEELLSPVRRKHCLRCGDRAVSTPETKVRFKPLRFLRSPVRDKNETFDEKRHKVGVNFQLSATMREGVKQIGVEVLGVSSAGPEISSVFGGNHVAGFHL